MAVTAYRDCEKQILAEKAATYYSYAMKIAADIEERFGVNEKIDS